MAARPGCEVVVLSEGDSYETSSLALLAPFLAPVHVRYVQAGRGLIVPPTCAVYVVAAQETWTEAWLTGHTTPLVGTEVDAGGEIWRFYDASPHTRDRFADALAGQPPLGRWVNGLLLRQVTASPQVRPGQVLEMTYVWEVTAPPAHPRYHFYNHLLRSADSALIAQEDGPGVYSAYWQTGDLIVTRFYIAVPPDAAGAGAIRMGVYTWPELERVPLETGQDGLVVATLSIQ
jgi:hypothetical protein